MRDIVLGIGIVWLWSLLIGLVPALVAGTVFSIASQKQTLKGLLWRTALGGAMAGLLYGLFLSAFWIPTNQGIIVLLITLISLFSALVLTYIVANPGWIRNCKIGVLQVGRRSLKWSLIVFGFWGPLIGIIVAAIIVIPFFFLVNWAQF